MRKCTIFLVILLLSACTTAEPTQTGSDIPADTPEEINWEKAKELVFSGEIETIVQAHDRRVILQDKDGNQFMTIEPELDDIIRVTRECGTKCANMSIMTE